MLADPTRPLLAHLVVTRRCNLDCGYCNEYDDFSDPVPTETLLERVDQIAALGTSVLTFSGGEPLLHPELDKITERVVSHGIVCTSITNGYPVTKRWIERLNKAGLTLLQISIDNLEPNDQSRKSWNKLKPKLELMQKHAKFGVNVNAVLGSSKPDETRQLASEVREVGSFMTTNLLHDGNGQISHGLAGDELAVLFEEMQSTSNKSIFHHVGEGWEKKMIVEGESPWRCRAGARYFYVDEFGMVSYCSQRRGEPGIPLAEYGRAELKRAFNTVKECAPKCTIACVRRASALDEWRRQDDVEERDATRLPVVQ